MKQRSLSAAYASETSDDIDREVLAQDLCHPQDVSDWSRWARAGSHEIFRLVTLRMLVEGVISQTLPVHLTGRPGSPQLLGYEILA